MVAITLATVATVCTLAAVSIKDVHAVPDHNESGRRDLLQLNVAGLLNIDLAKRDQAPFSIPKFYRPFATARRREEIHSTLGVVNIEKDDEVLGSLLYDGSSKTLNASTQNSTVIYLVQVPNNTSYTTDDGSHDSDVKIVRMVLLGLDPADTVRHCAAYDPNPPQPESLNVMPCRNATDMSPHMSQFFAFNETGGKLSPMWFSAQPVQPAAASSIDGTNSRVLTRDTPQSGGQDVTLIFVPSGDTVQAASSISAAPSSATVSSSTIVSNPSTSLSAAAAGTSTGATNSKIASASNTIVPDPTDLLPSPVSPASTVTVTVAAAELSSSASSASASSSAAVISASTTTSDVFRAQVTSVSTSASASVLVSASSTSVSATAFMTDALEVVAASAVMSTSTADDSVPTNAESAAASIASSSDSASSTSPVAGTPSTATVVASSDARVAAFETMSVASSAFASVSMGPGTTSATSSFAASATTSPASSSPPVVMDISSAAPSASATTSPRYQWAFKVNSAKDE
ncbi:hypothetical protein FISHEDRAFT_72146 [Fistulina hepatica ATCC 64428]|uniref:Uncharacterized protein n=1 Tax=Fistulina hepatica ATCC 64428 TaxID=1128425 RepID=A0A0D7AHW6_9AGAR|nr:hypothetical protein FISHEDRAFT_72146 [Fistulina hepatica ATCC 64428]